MGRWFSRVLPDALAAVATLALTWPMWHQGGYGLARDLVFTPRAPWTLDAIGMGSSLPRAVPLDAVLAALTSAVDGAVVFRVAVAGVLVGAGAGAHRLLVVLLPSAPNGARCLVAVGAVWNPYVVERLALGQWALLAGYAALWWLLPGVRRVLAGERSAWFAVVAALGLGSLTPSGGAMLVLVAVAGLALCAFTRSRVRVATQVLLVSLVAQLPWVLAGLLGATPATSDPGGVEAFAARAERAGGVWPTLLATGGVWSPFEVPGSLTSWPGHVLTAAVVLALLAGIATVVRHEPALALAAAVGVVVAGAAHLPGGADALGWAVANVPGAGLLRDGQKWLLPYAVLAVSSAGVAASRAATALGRRDVDLARVVSGLLVVLPVVLLPDAAGRTWAAVEPVHYPAELGRAVAELDAEQGSGDVATLPWASYRRFSWGNPLSAADPLPRWTTRPAVVSDSLPVPGGSVAGEDPRAREVAAVVARPAGPLADRLAAVGVGWVLVYLDQPGARDLDSTGLSPVVAGPDVALYRVPHVDTDNPSAPGDATVVAVAATDIAWAVALVGALAAAALSRVRRLRRGPQEVTDR